MLKKNIVMLFIFLSGCVYINHARSVKVAEVYQGSSVINFNYDKFYSESNHLLFVFRNYDCKAIPDGEVSVKISDKKHGLIADETFDFSDLTWVQSEQCTPVAFLRGKNGGYPLDFKRRFDSGGIDISIKVSNFRANEGVSMIVWSAANSMPQTDWILKN